MIKCLTDMKQINMTEGYKHRYNYVLRESDQSTDSADEGPTLSHEEKESDFHFIDNYLREIKYEYIWLSDGETLTESGDCAGEKVRNSKEPKATEEKHDLQGNLCKGINSSQSNSCGLMEITEQMNEKCISKNHVSDNSVSVGNGQNTTNSRVTVVGCRNDITSRNLNNRNNVLNEGVNKQTIEGELTGVKDDTKHFPIIAHKKNTCAAQQKGTVYTLQQYKENENDICVKNEMCRNGNKTQLKKKEVESIEPEDKIQSLCKDNIERDKRKAKVKHECRTGRIRKTDRIMKHLRGKNKLYAEKLENVQDSKGKGNFKSCDKNTAKCKISKSKHEVSLTRRSDKLETPTLCESSPIPKECSVLDLCASVEEIESLSKENESFKKMCKPGKHAYRRSRGKRNKSLSPPINTDCVNEQFLIREDDTLFRSLKQVPDNNSGFQNSNVGKKVKEHHRENNTTGKCASKHLKADFTKFTDKNAAKEKVTPRLSEPIKRSKNLKRINAANLTKVRKCVKNRETPLEREQINLPKCNSWLRCMPTPTTGKLLEKKNDKVIQIENETTDLGQSHSCEQVQNVGDDCKISDLKTKLVETKQVTIGVTEPAVTKEGKEDLDVSVKEQMKEYSSKILHFTNTHVEASKGVDFENQEVVITSNEMCHENRKQLESKTYISDQESKIHISEQESETHICYQESKTCISEQITCEHSEATVGKTSNHGTKIKDRISKAVRFRRTYSRRKGKEVKVFRTVKGIGKIEFRYPCKFCGELFSKSYVGRHEKTHHIEGSTCSRSLFQRCHPKTDADRSAVIVKTVSGGKCSSMTKSSSRTFCLTEQASSSESSKGSPGANLITNSNKENVKSMPSPTVLEADLNIDHAEVKAVTKDVKNFCRITEVCSTKKLQTEGLTEESRDTGSFHGNKTVSDKLVDIKPSSSASNQSTFNDSCQAEIESSSSLPETSNTLKKVEITANKTVLQSEVKCENRSELYEGKYSCTMCTYSSQYFRYLKRHKTVHDSCSKTVTCNCGITFRNTLTMKQWHKRNNISHGIEHTKKASSSLGSKNSRRKVKRFGREGRKKLLKSKGKVLKSVKIKRRTNNRQKCEKCNYKFSNTSNWIRHEQLHENNTGFTCLECSITMKTRCSLAFWHHRHGIYHPRVKRKRRTKQKKEKQKHGSVKNDLFGTSTQEASTEVAEITETQSCGDCNALIGVKDVEHIKLNEKLDGTTCDKCSLRLENAELIKARTLGTIFKTESVVSAVDRENKIDDNKFAEKSLANIVRESINSSLKELSVKFKDQQEDKPISEGRITLEENQTDLDLNIVEQTEAVLNELEHPMDTDMYKEEDGSFRKNEDFINYLLENKEGMVNASHGDVIEKTLKAKEVPVYPLLRKLSLKDGEQIFNPVNDQIEVFEKECDMKKKYRKVKVLNIDTNGCKEKIDALSGFIPDLETDQVIESSKSQEENGEGIRTLAVKENRAVNHIAEPLDLSKKCEQEGLRVKENLKVTISFQIQLDFDRNNVTSCKPYNLQTNVFFNNLQEYLNDVQSPANEIANCSLTDSVRAKIILKNIQAKPNSDKPSLIVDKCNMSHASVQQTSSVQVEHHENTITCQRSGLVAESDVHDQSKHCDEMNVDGQKKDVYTFTDDESDDEILYYASKLQESLCGNDDIVNWDKGKYEQLDTVCVNTIQDQVEESVCDTGGTDENNNREKEGSDRIKEEGHTRDNGNKNGNCNEKTNVGRGEGNGDDEDDDDKENNDKNNNIGSADEIQNVELLPCLVCQAIFNNKTELSRHLTKIHRLTNLCQICYFDEGEIRRFANPVSLRNHKVRDHPEDMVKCVCGAMLIDTKMLSSHLKKFKCNLYESGGESNEMAKCICGKRFSSQEMLFNHRSKCRKRHCLDETFLDFMSTPSTEKKRCLKTTTVETVRTTETTGMTLRAKPTDINNNVSLSENRDTSIGRISKVRKCKGSVGSYNEKVYDKFFETDVNLSKMSKRKSYGIVEQTRRYERLTCTKTSSESLLTTDNEVLDLRTKPARDRSADTLTENVTLDSAQLDTNNNYTVQGASTSYIGGKKDERIGKLSCKSSVRCLEEEDETELTKAARHESTDTNNNLAETQHKVGRRKKLIKSDSGGQSKKRIRGKRRKKIQPDAEGKYPCKICRRRYKRPYLYTHQRIAHARKQWILVPTTSLQNTDGYVKYRCSWCRFVSLHWGTAVRHHYMQHQRQELDLITLITVPKVFPDQHCSSLVK